MKKIDEKTFYLDREDIFLHLKNRPPLLMIDHVYVEPGERAYTTQKLDASAWYFECHFPGKPMMPGVLQLESIFNTAAMPIKLLDGYKDKTTNIVQVKDVKYKRHILPGDEIDICAQVLKFRRGLANMKGTVSVRDDICCEAEFVLVVLDDVPKIQ